jgi:hypothetical protein
MKGFMVGSICLKGSCTLFEKNDMLVNHDGKNGGHLA